MIFDFAVENTAEAIKAIKEDDVSLKLVSEYKDYGRNPRSDLSHQ